MSINYYNQNFTDFIDRTLSVDMSTLTNRFLSLVVDKGVILDLGCGSGRDSKTFMSLGYDVYAIDGSEEMVNHARAFLGDRVTCSTFQAYRSDRTYDGIWAAASLLHVPENEMASVVAKYRDMLNDEGIFYMSFKLRDENFVKGERSFTCYTPDKLLSLIEDIGGLDVLEILTTEDVRSENIGEQWVNAFLRKQSI
jgi:2-polyprenyl-3-methyl-5-hydroxy-6-metoxy-1,4-benzoquinol methylase